VPSSALTLLLLLLHKHAQALQAQATTHQQALADLVKQHQEVCGRLAAAATAEADMKQQMQRLHADRQTLQQQVEKVRERLGVRAVLQPWLC
jgi:predicted  nucleic acid-binding Zn-ribbon protein